MNTAIIVQARMSSTRLPGKVLKTVIGKTLLEYQIERLRRVKSADRIVIATTDKQAEQPIVDLCDQLGISCFRGSETDVLARYYGAAAAHNADVVVRITSDCPLIDPAVVDRVIRFYQEHRSDYDYATNTLEPELTYPRGMDTEIFSFQSLKEAYHLSKRTTLYAIQAYQHASGSTLGLNGAIVDAAPSVGDAENATPSSTRNQFVGMAGIAVLF